MNVFHGIQAFTFYKNSTSVVYISEVCLAQLKTQNRHQSPCIETDQSNNKMILPRKYIKRKGTAKLIISR